MAVASWTPACARTDCQSSASNGLGGFKESIAAVRYKIIFFAMLISHSVLYIKVQLLCFIHVKMFIEKMVQLCLSHGI